MNQSGWVILLTLIVWSKCDPQLKPLLGQDDQWETSDEDSMFELPIDDSHHANKKDIDQSASSNVHIVKNQSDLSASLAHLIKNHNLYPQLENLKKTQPNHLVSDLLKNLTNNSNEQKHTNKVDIYIYA